MSEQQHKAECLTRHYQNMGSARVHALKNELSKAAYRLLVQRVNKAKGYEFI